MKKVLIVDIDRCFDCPCLEIYEDWLGFIYKAKCRRLDKEINVVDAEKFPDICPLKPLPEKLEYLGIGNDNEQISKSIGRTSWFKKAIPNDAICIKSYSIGFNACIDEILGETDD